MPLVMIFKEGWYSGSACVELGETVCVEEEEGRKLKGVYMLEGRERREGQGRGTRDAAVKGMGKGREYKTHS